MACATTSADVGRRIFLKSLEEHQCCCRDEEVQALQRHFEESKRSAVVTTVSGVSGSGKSSLVFAQKQRWMEVFNKNNNNTTTDGGYLNFVSGKYEIESTQPLAPLIDALYQAIEQYHRHEKEEDESLKNLLTQEQSLRSILPNVYKKLGLFEKPSSPTNRRNSQTISQVFSSSSDMLVSAIWRLLIVLLSRGDCDDDNADAKEGEEQFLMNPPINLNRLVLVLDDVQRADELSIKFLSKLPNFFDDLQRFHLILIHRNDDYDNENVVDNAEEEGKEEDNEDRDPITALIKQWGETKEEESTTTLGDGSSSLLLRSIEISEFDCAQVMKVLASYFQMKDIDAVRPLAQIIYDKTNGNPFFVARFARLLVEEQHIHYNMINLSWEWTEDDIDKIKGGVGVSTQVADLLVKTIEKLPTETQNALMIASCMGMIIPLKTFEEIFDDFTTTGTIENNNDGSEEYKHDNDDTAGLSIEKIIAPAIDQGILIRRGTTTYEWGHDKLQDAAYSLIPKDRIGDLHMKIGRLLFAKSSEASDRDMTTFMAAEQMIKATERNNNFISDAGGEDIASLASVDIDLAKLNLEAAKISIHRSAFYPAMRFLRAGIKNLGSEEKLRWGDKLYGLTVELLNFLAQIGQILGHHEEARKAADEVVVHAKCLEDKFYAYKHITLLILKTTNRDYIQVADYLLSIIPEYGVNIPRRPSAAYIAVEKFKLERFADLDSILSLPESNDILFNHLLDHLGQLEVWSLCGKLSNLAIAASISALRQCIKKRVHNPSACSALFGMAIFSKHRLDFQGAIKYSELAVNLCMLYPKQHGSLHSQVLTRSFTGTTPLLRPFHETMDGLLEAYEAGLLYGDLEFAFGGAMGYSLAYFCVGLPLRPLEPDLDNFQKEVRQYGMNYAVGVLFAIMRQTILNLTDPAVGSKTLLRGKAMDEVFVLGSMEGNVHKMTLRDISTFRLLLACVFYDLDAASKAVDIVSSHPFEDLMIGRLHLRVTYLGVAAFLLWHERGNKNHKKIGRKAMGFMKSYAKNGSVNASISLLVLQALEAPSQAMYDKAIATCGRSGLLNFQAFLNERAGEYFLLNDDVDWGRDYLTRARDLYEEWGAEPKVAMMVESHPFLRQPLIREGSKNTTLRARSRHSMDIQSTHNSIVLSKRPTS